MPDALPIWDLTDLYADNSTSIHLDLNIAKKQTEKLVQYEGRLSQMTGAELAVVIADYQSISERLSRIISHADLQFAADMANPQTGQHAQGMKEKISGFSSQLLFIELELAAIDEDRFQQALSDPDFYFFLPWLSRLRAFAPHQLETRLEQMLVERAPAGHNAWARLFDETATALRFPFQGTEVTEAEILNKLSDPSADIRKEAGQSLSGVMQSNQPLFSLILNVIAKDKEIEDRWRGFDRPVSSRNLANDVDDTTVDSLVGAVTASMPNIAHRYYKLKAGWMGSDEIPWWDRNAPLPENDDRRFNWSDAQQIVTDAFNGFDQPMALVAQRFFDRNWIDAEVRQGKASGAFSHPTVPSAHPYILMNFDGRARDVMTLAHEMGHGIHQVLAADKGYLMADTPLTLAETASVFAEMLAFQTLVDKAPNDVSRRFLLAGKVEDMLNTVVRQIAFHNFETAFHDARKSGEVSAEALSDLWMQTQTQALGPAVRLDDSYRPIWAYIPHFVHTPFYVYAYAFGDCLVNALWQNYQVKSAADKLVFSEQYIQLLKAGGTKRYNEALEPFDLNPADASFWNMGLDMIAGMIDELESLS